MRKKLLSTLLALCVLLELCVPAVAANAHYKDLGALRVAMNGDIYQSKALLEESTGKVYLPAATVEEFLGRCPVKVTVNGASWGDVSAAVDSCVYDAPLGSLYIWDSLPDMLDAADILHPEFGAATDKPITYRQFFTMLDAAVKLADPAKLSAWQAKLPQARVSDRQMSRLEGAEAMLYLAATLGEAYTEFNTHWQTYSEEMGEGAWTETERVPYHNDLIPDPNPYNLGGFQQDTYVYEWALDALATFYTIGRCSLISNATLYDYDREAHSLHLDQPLTAKAAAAALTRLVDSVEKSALPQTVALTAPAATHYDESILTPELLEWSKKLPVASSDTMWNGAVLGYDYNVRHIDVSGIPLYVRKLSEYGFNCVRYMLTYETLFDRKVTSVNLDELRKLDQLVAYAIRYRIHLNLVTFSMPGRWVENYEDYTDKGEFDLFTNPERQAEARAVWRLLATRYADVPSSALSFQPLWEVLNQNLSTGLSGEPYTAEDVAPVYADLVKTIRACDPDRLIIYEPTPNNGVEGTVEESQPTKQAMEQFDNVQLLTNFCSNAYVYAEMTAESDANIDNCNHSMFKPSYPVTVYDVQERITRNAPLVLKGDLPAGTRIELYLDRNTGGTCQILADGKSIYSENLAQRGYTVEARLSGYYPYAKSDKKIAVTLSSDAETVSLTFTGDELRWSGMNVILPEEYAVERWWYTSGYDIFLGLEEERPPEKRKTSDIMLCPTGSDDTGPITIDAKNVSFTSGAVLDEASREQIFDWGHTISAFAPGSAARLERACFTLGTDYASALAYYGDILDMCGEYGLGWFINETCDMVGLFQPQLPGRDVWDLYERFYSGAKYTTCADGWTLKEMLQVFQGHMPVETPASQAEGYVAVSNWAKDQVDKANSNGLVPDGLGNDYRVNITRAQFAAVAVKLYEAMSGQAAPAPGKSPFTDTNNAAVIQAEALGIVGGVGGGKFAPDSPVTREQAATMLSRVYTKLGGEIPEGAATTFADNDKVAKWAMDAVAFMSGKEIVGGVGGNRFDPAGNASIEQALAIALRMFEKLK